MKKNVFIALLLLLITNAYAQWPADPRESIRVAGSEMATITSGPHKGKTWTCWNNLRPQTETIFGVQIPVYYKATYVQLIDSNGNKLFGPDGMKVTEQRAGASFTTVGDKLFVDREGNAIVASVDGRGMKFDTADPRNRTYNQAQTFLYKIAPELNEGDLDFLWNEHGVSPTGKVNGLEANQHMIQLTDAMGNPGDYVFTVQQFAISTEAQDFKTYTLAKNTGAVKTTVNGHFSAMLANNNGTYFALTSNVLSKRSSGETEMWNRDLLNRTYSAKPKKNNENLKESGDVKAAADGKNTMLASDGKGGVVLLVTTLYNYHFVYNVAYFDADGNPYFKNPNTDKAYVAVGSMAGYAQLSAVTYEPTTNSIYVGSTHFNTSSQSWGYAAIQRINGNDGTLEFGPYGKIIDGSPTMNQYGSPQVTPVPGCDSVYFAFSVNSFFPVYLVNHENEHQWCAQIALNKGGGGGGALSAADFVAGGVVYAWGGRLNKLHLSGIIGNSDPIVCCGPGTGIDCPCVEGINCLCDTTNCACDTCKLEDYCDPNSLCSTTCPDADRYCFCLTDCQNIDTCVQQECGGCPNAIYQACPTAVSNESETTGMTITPNPAYENITIKVKEGEIVKTVDIYDMSGKMMMPRIFHPANLQISLKNLAAGTYTLVITTQNGTASKIFIKN